MNKQIFCLTAVMLFAFLPVVMAVDFNQEPSDSDRATFDQILEPVMSIYNFVKYLASAIAAIALLFAGITYMTSGSDPRKRDNAKSMATYIVVGLVVVWAAPYIVQIIVN